MNKFYYLLILSLIYISCEKKTSNGLIDNTQNLGVDSLTNDYTQYLGVDSLPTEIIFYPEEIYENPLFVVDTPALKLFCVTNSEYGSCDFEIMTTCFIKNKEFIIRFDSVYKSSNYICSRGPADAYIDMPTDITKLTLINGHQIDVYQIFISKEKITINSIIESYTNLLYGSTFRYPENTLEFGCRTNEKDTSIYSDFINLMVNEITINEYTFNGEGRIPYSCNLALNTDQFHCLFFKYNVEADFDKAGELLKEYTLENISQNDGNSLWLVGWNHKHFFSDTYN